MIFILLFFLFTTPVGVFVWIRHQRAKHFADQIHLHRSFSKHRSQQ